jgi:hypothetical protein
MILDIINTKYSLTEEIVNWKEIDSILLTKNEKEEYIKNEEMKKDQINLITKYYFITFKSLQLGIFKIEENYQEIIKVYRETLKKLEEYKNYGVRFSKEIEIENKNIEILKKVIWGIEIHIFENGIISSLTRFFNWTSVVIRNIIDQKKDGFLNEEVPIEFSILPEFFFQLLSDYILFMLKYKHDTVSTYDCNISKCFDFMTLLVGNKNYILNPNIRCNFVNIYLIFR